MRIWRWLVILLAVVAALGLWFSRSITKPISRLTGTMEALAEGDPDRAAGIFSQVVDMAPEDAGAHAGLIRALTH